MTKLKIISIGSLVSLGITAVISAAISVKFYTALTLHGAFSVRVEDQEFVINTFASSVCYILIWLGCICLANACVLFFGLRGEGLQSVSRSVFIEAGLFLLGLVYFAAFMWIYLVYYAPNDQWQIPTEDHGFFIKLIGTISLKVLPFMSVVLVAFAFALWRRFTKKISSRSTVLFNT